MGIKWSKRNHNNHPIIQPETSLPPPPLPPHHTSPPPLPPHTSQNFPHAPPQNPYPPSHAPTPFPPPYNNYNSYPYSYNNSNYRPHYFPPQITGWGPPVPPRAIPPQPPLQHVPYVDHQSAKKVKNDVNVHKDTIKLVSDDVQPDCLLVSFIFDASVDGSITIFYFAKEGDNCSFTPTYPEIVPVKVPFKKGAGQQFCQPSGTGVDLGFFDIDDLSKPVPGEGIYPLIISAESCGTEEHENTSSPHAQISQAVLEKKEDGNFQVKVMKQILWVDGARYELRDIFGISDSAETAIGDVDSGKECVICMTEDKNTAVLPCRHMCMCSECAKELRLQSNKCPICRQPIEELLEINQS